MADSTKLEPIILPQWPSCTHCLVSSEDDLAVASGENVHILTPRGKASAKDPGPYSHWHNSTIHVNQFSDDEWPLQTLSNIEHFSIGEEQSKSFVTSLEWSHPGLGLHKRSVLAILTSNLVLSLWETDGSLGQYRRTCVLNKCLPTKDDLEQDFSASRRSQRIRAFAWTKPLKNDHTSKYGTHYMIVANDADEIMTLCIAKTVPSKYGTWLIQLSSQALLSDLTCSNTYLSTLAPLQQRIYDSTIVSKITCDDWEQLSTDPESTERTGGIARAQVTCGQTTYAIQLDAVITNLTSDKSVNSNWMVLIHAVPDAQMKSDGRLQSSKQDFDSSQANELENQFKNAVKPLAMAFNHQYSLGGHYRVKFWGTCQVLTRPRLAACITLHPTDMIEHTQPSVEKCILIFVPTGKPFTTGQLKDISDLEVRNLIVEFALSQLQNVDCVRTVLDIKILKMMISISNALLGGDTMRHIFDTALQRGIKNMTILNDNNNLRTTPHEGLSITGDHDRDLYLQVATSEQCDICSSNILFLSDSMSAKCNNNHEFTRCNLSFLAIQEPGISKYCSGCGRQFLDTIKLEVPPDTGFGQSLFDHFDVCPYCGAKFRG